LEEGGFSGLPRGVEYPIEFILYIPMQLSPDKPFLRGEHIMIFRVTGARGIKKPNSSLAHFRKVYMKGLINERRTTHGKHVV
jgi:hypothetical protein